MLIPKAITSPFIITERITDEEGKPTPYFLQQWANQQGLNVASEEVITSLNTVEGRNLTAGVGLDGGGDLSADRTFDLADTAVTAGTYGDATNSPQITIDAQGRITSAADVAISGGGGGSMFAWPTELDEVLDTTGFAFKGFIADPFMDVDITNIFGHMSLVSGGSYRAGVYRLAGSNAINEITAQSSIVVAPGATTFLPQAFPLTATLVANSRYAIMVGRTESTANHALTITSEGLAATEVIPYPTLPFFNYDAGGFPGTRARLASTGPALTDTVALGSSNIVHGIWLLYILP